MVLGWELLTTQQEEGVGKLRVHFTASTVPCTFRSGDSLLLLLFRVPQGGICNEKYEIGILYL